MRKHMENKFYWNEFLFSIYFFVFTLIKPISANFPQYAFTILLFICIIVLIVWAFINGFKVDREKAIKAFILFIIFAMLFLMSYIFMYNDFINVYAQGFLIYAIMPMILLLNVKNYEKIILYWCRIGMVSGLTAFVDPFIEYKMFGDYMTFGYVGMLPVFASFLLYSIYFKKYKWLIMDMLVFIDIFVFANKGAALTCIILAIIAVCFFAVNRIQRIVAVLLSGGALFLSFFYSNKILLFFFKLLNSLNMTSYSLNTVEMMLNGKTDSILSLRTDIWKIVLEHIDNNIILGEGIGTFTSYYGTYPHNIFLDIADTFGIIALVIFVYLTIKSIILIVKNNNECLKYFAIFMFVLWLIPMLMSLTYWQYMPVWVYFIISYYISRGKKIVEKNR